MPSLAPVSWSWKYWLDELVDETVRFLTTQLRAEVGDRVAADGSNATLTVSGIEVRAKVDPNSCARHAESHQRPGCQLEPPCPARQPDARRGVRRH